MFDLRMLTLFINLPRLEASIVLHSDPNLKARLAAATAMSISALNKLK